MYRKMILPSSILVATILLGTVAQPALAQTAPTVAPDAIRAHIDFLASDKLKGRGSGEKGNEEAARYIAAAFKKYGLKPVGTGKQSDPKATLDGSGYFQPFSFPYGVGRGKDNRLQVTWPGQTKRYTVGNEFEPFALSANGKVSADIVFVGYGLQSREPVRDDYAGVDVTGKVVCVMAGNPAGAVSTVDIPGKAAIARSKGAAAVIIVPSGDRTDAFQNASDFTSADAGLPILQVRRTIAEEWFRASGKTLSVVESALVNGPQAFPLGVKATLNTDIQRLTRTTANIIGLLEGSDPALKNEVVVIGAHMDHLGMGGSHSLAEDRKPAIHHGADDNASGTAGVLALAELFSQPANRPKRSLLFICFSGEEMGLLGSSYYVRTPILPLDRTVTMLNMDMVGRMKENRLSVLGVGSSTSFGALLDQLNTDAKFDLKRDEGSSGGSDHQPFYNNKVPVLFFFTGLHADYHRPSDTADKINAADTARVVSLVALTTRRIADTPKRPVYQQATVAASAPRPRARASLGTIPEYGNDVVGVQIGGVRPGSPAEAAGIKAGDVLIQFGERAIRNIEEYTFALSEYKPGDVVKIVVKRGNENITLTATLAESRRP